MRVRIAAGVSGLILAGGLLSGSQAVFVREPVGTAQPDGAGGFLKAARASAAIPAANGEEAVKIPVEAVRLRIVANSDSPEDQALKRKVRDRVIDEVGKRLRGVSSREEARQAIQAAIPELNEKAAGVIREAGASYQTRTDYGMVPFPTKLYGDTVYPAGEYEALRIVIGEGQGQNWWCVLFPPLCFVDLANGDAVQAKDMDAKSKPLATVEVPAGDGKTAQTVQVRLGILDLLNSFFAKIGEFVKSIFK